MDTELVDYQKHLITFFPFDGIIITQAHAFVNRIIEIIFHMLGTQMLNCFYIVAQILRHIVDTGKYFSSALAQSECLLSGTS